MAEVERYRIEWTAGSLEEAEDGPYVRYDDHRAALQAVEAERDKAREDCTTLRHTTVVRLCEERDQANTRATAAERQREEAAEKVRALRSYSPGDSPSVVVLADVEAALTPQPDTEREQMRELVREQSKVMRGSKFGGARPTASEAPRCGGSEDEAKEKERGVEAHAPKARATEAADMVPAASPAEQWFLDTRRAYQALVKEGKAPEIPDRF